MNLFPKKWSIPLTVILALIYHKILPFTHMSRVKITHVVLRIFPVTLCP